MEREKFLSSIYLIIKNDKGEVLLQRRQGTKLWPGFLALPAGHIDEGENAYEAAVREAREELGIEIVNEFEKAISLRVIDHNWMEHISTMSHLREGVGLRGYANVNPLQAYTSEGYELFDNMLNKINSEISIYLLKSEIRQNTERKEVVKKVITNDGKETVKKSKKSSKVGRNDPCPCGSGKKYKQCCGK